MFCQISHFNIYVRTIHSSQKQITTKMPNEIAQEYRIMLKRLLECTFLCITLLLFDGNFVTLHQIKVDGINLLM